MLHASPVSSQIFVEDYFPIFAKHFCCIAPDTPGNGLSDPLPDANAATIDDYAVALARFLDAIGVRECNLYGRHTGAEIALAMAQQVPDRVPFVYCDGYPVFEKHEVAALADGYLPHFEPDAWGGFLSRLWFRYRDQHVFWSWHQQDNDHAADVDVPDLTFIHKGALDFLLSGNDYIAPYAAALDYGATDAWRRAATPTCFAIRPGDSLFGVQARLTDLPDGCWKQELPRETEQAVKAELEILLKHAKPTTNAELPVPAWQGSTMTPLFVSSPDVELFVRYYQSTNPTKRPLVLIPHIPGGGSYLEDRQIQLAADRDVILIDPPGHGDSTFEGPHAIPAYCDAIEGAMHALGLDAFDVEGHRTGAMLVTEVAKRDACSSAAAIEPFDPGQYDLKALAKRYDLDLTPCWEGSHFLRLWHHLRDENIWFPWDARTITARKHDDWAFDLSKHLTNFVDTAKQMENYGKGWSAVLAQASDSV